MTGSVATGISRIIAQKGLVQKTVAKRAGFNTQQFSDMINGRKVIRADYIVPISNALGVSIQELFDAGREFDTPDAV